MSGRGGRGGRGRGGGQRGGKINSNSVPWAMDPSISIELTGKPGELFPVSSKPSRARFCTVLFLTFSPGTDTLISYPRNTTSLSRPPSRKRKKSRPKPSSSSASNAKAALFTQKDAPGPSLDEEAGHTARTKTTSATPRPAARPR